MAGEERLRLIAEFRDNASAGVRRLGRELGEVRETPGMTSAARWMQGFTTNARAAQQAGTGAGSIMGSLGIGGLAAAGGIAAAVKSFKDLAEQKIALQSLSRETGLAVDQINILKHAARDMHVDPEAMSAGIKNFTGEMEQARLGLGKLYGALNLENPALANKLKSEGPAEAVKDYLDWLSRIPDAQMKAGKSQADGIALQKRWLSLGFGSDDVDKLVEQGPAKLAEALADAAKNTPKTTQAMIAGAEALSKAVHDLDDAIEKVQTDAGPFIFKQLTQATDDFRAVFDAVSAARDKYKDHPEKVETDAKQQAESGWQHFKKHWSDVGEGKTPLLPNPLDSKSWHLPQPDPKAGLFDVTKEPEGPAPSGIFLPDILKNFRDSVGGIPGDEYGTGAAEPRISTPDTSALDKLRGAMEHRDGPAPIVMPPALLNHPALDKLRGAMQGGGGQAPIVLPNSLLHHTSYSDDEEGGERSSAGGMSPNLVMLFRETIASGTKAGYLAAVRELQGEVAGGAGGGFQNASFETGGGAGGAFGSGAGGRRAPSLRYGRQHSAAPFMDAGGGADGAAVHDTLKDLISQHETGTTGAGGYDTAYGHAEQPGSKLHALAPPKPISQMTIADVLAYQREMKPRAGSAAFPVGRAQWTESTLRGLTRGMDPGTIFSPEIQEKLFDRSIAGRIGQGVGGFRSEWASLNHVDAGTIQGAISGHRTGVGFSGGSTGVTGKTAGVNPVLTDMVKRASEILGVPLSVYSGLRSPEHNAAVHGAEHSLHMRGLATDLTTPGHPKSDRAFWERANGAMRQAAEEYHQPYRWGGTFGGRFARDNDHFDLTANGPSADALAKHMGDLEKKQDQLATHQSKTLSVAHRLLKWATKGANAEDPSDTPLETRDMRNMRFAPPGFHKPEEPRKSLLDEANKAGIGGAVKVEHSGGATVEIRGLPQGKGTRVKTSGMIEAVNIRRGPQVQVG